LLGVVLILAGCASERMLMPMPKLYFLSDSVSRLNVAVRGKGQLASVLYVTDRQPTVDEQGGQSYSYQRSHSLGYGVADVQFAAGTPGSDASESAGAQPVKLYVESVREYGRAPRSPYPGQIVDGQFVIAPDVQFDLTAVATRFQDQVREMLTETSRKEAFVYVHGVQNTFSEAVYVTAELWHYLGREGVPITYTWPAGRSGLLRGYSYDRESSEFTVFHLKEFIRTLTDIPELSAVHIIAHSRGTDAVTAAIRELSIESRAAGVDPLRRYRIKNLVLAAPDLDIDVVMQRLGTERIGLSVDRITIYTSRRDKALGISELLFGGLRRLGQADATNLSRTWEQEVDHDTNVAMIEYVGRNIGDFGHNYFKQSPAVASDLILTVKHDRDPGAENGRPLQRRGNWFWVLDDSYLDKARGVLE
jgi:esterase/lipase superfamily enzyme